MKLKVKIGPESEIAHWRRLGAVVKPMSGEEKIKRLGQETTRLGRRANIFETPATTGRKLTGWT